MNLITNSIKQYLEYHCHDYWRFIITSYFASIFQEIMHDTTISNTVALLHEFEFSGCMNLLMDRSPVMLWHGFIV